MPMPSTDHVRQALERLADDRDFQVVLEHLRGLEAEAIQRAVEATDMLLIGRAQGQVQLLQDFKALADPAIARRRT
jgi:hypothetical protein